MYFLTKVEMDEVKETFRESLSHVVSNYAPDSAPDVLKFVYGIALLRKPYLAVTKNGLDELVDIIFTKEMHRDFVLTLSFIFFSRWGHSEEQIEGLAGNLARGVSSRDEGETKKDNFCVIPTELLDRLSTTEEAKELIYANRWFMVILLMQLYVTLTDTDKGIKE